MPKQKLTCQQAATRKINLLKMDMIAILDETPERFETPYNPIAPIHTAINNTIITIQQHMQQSHRIATLINLYYLGELLNTTNNPQQNWKDYLQNNMLSNPRRYYCAATCVYETFQGNMEQIYRTKYFSMYYITGMTNSDYRNNFLPFVKNHSSEDFAF
jgi:hypothetical protein